MRQRGIDVQSLDAKFEAKAKSLTKFTLPQEEQLEVVRQELTRLEALWREANEKELPEEVYRVQAEAKREELKNLMKDFSKQQHDETYQSSLSSSSSSPRVTTTNGSKSNHTKNGGFTPVGKGATTTTGRKQHYLPPVTTKNGSATTTKGAATEPFAAMSRHRFGATTQP